MSNKNRVIVAITGASGAIYGIEALKMLREFGVETHLILSKASHITIKQETSYTISEIKELADNVYSVENIAASISSGSFLTSGMIIAPCSIKTMSEIAYGLTSNLVSRAADVVLKERRKLVIMLRETPLNISHIDSMRKITEMGGVISPPVPAFYNNPKTINDLVVHSVGRSLDLFSLHSNDVKRWKE